MWLRDISLVASLDSTELVLFIQNQSNKYLTQSLYQSVIFKKPAYLKPMELRETELEFITGLYGQWFAQKIKRIR